MAVIEVDTRIYMYGMKREFYLYVRVVEAWTNRCSIFWCWKAEA